MLSANKLKCNAVAHLLHRNVKATSEEKSSLFSNPSGLSKTGNLPRCGRFAVCAYTCTSRALHLACFAQSQNLGSGLNLFSVQDVTRPARGGSGGPDIKQLADILPEVWQHFEVTPKLEEYRVLFNSSRKVPD